MDAGGGDTSVPLPPRIQTIAHGLAPLLECTTRLWGSDSWSDRQILFVSNKDKQAFLWNDQAQKGTMHRVVFETLPAAVTDDFYFDVVNYEGVKTLAVSLDITAMLNRRDQYTDTAILFAIHEGFHIFAQASWSLKPTSEPSEREPDYPDSWRLRWLRSQVLDALYESLDSNAPLAKAAFWNQTLRAEFASEMMSVASTDILEGSAQFATTVAVILGKLGCDASNAAVVEEMKSAKTFLSLDALMASKEPYDLGLLALLLLRRNGAAGYEAKIATGTPPVDALLDGVAPLTQTEDAAAAAQAKATIEARNAAAAKWIEPLLTRYRAPEARRVVIPSWWMVGAFGVGDSFYAINEPGRPHVTNEFAVTMQDPASGAKIKLKNVAVVEDVSTPCGANMLVVPVEAAGIIVSADESTLTANTGLEATAFPIHAKTDTAGLEWLCAGAM